MDSRHRDRTRSGPLLRAGECRGGSATPGACTAGEGYQLEDALKLLLGELGYKPHEAYDLLSCELDLILAGFHGRLKRERDGRAWLASHIELAHRYEKWLAPWELLGEEDPDEARREQAAREAAEVAHELIGVPKVTETPEEVLSRFGLLKEDASAGNG